MLSPRIRRYWQLFGMLLAASSVSSCARPELEQEVLAGSRELEPSPDEGEEPCEAGASRCADGRLQYCLRTDTDVPVWLDHTDCGSPDLCSSGPPAVCLRPACDAGQVDCEGGVRRRCNETGSAWQELAACESEAHCSTDLDACNGEVPCCIVEPCSAGERRCSVGVLEECEADGDGWSVLATCGSSELCLAGLAECADDGADCGCLEPVCEAGQVRCSDATLEQCGSELTRWDVVGECASPELCLLGLELEPVRCEAPACSEGQSTCDGATLRSCREDRSGFDLSDECIGAAFCNAGSASCELAPCEPGQRSCNGAQIQVCAEDQTGFEPEGAPCATAELCNDDDPLDVHCDQPACAEGELSCFGGDQLQICNSARTGFIISATCERAELCSAERRRCDFCVPGRQECTPDLSASRVCAQSGGLFGPQTSCPLGCEAATGQCRTCTVGEYRCDGGQLSRCEDGRSFSPLNRSGDCSGGQVVECSGNVVTRRNCAPGFACEGAGSCECTPGAVLCDDDQLVVCTGTRLEPAARCQGEDGDVLITCDNGELNVNQCNNANQCNRSEGRGCNR